LADALARLGVSVCFDQDVLEPGDNWHALLPGYVEASAMVVALVSADTGAAHFQNSEVVRAIKLVRERGRRLVPVWLAPEVEAPYGTEQLHRLEMFDSATVDGVARQLARLVPERAAPAPVGGAGVFSDAVPALPRVFAGRDDLVKRVLARLVPGGVGLVTQAIAGMGGVGKTTLAAAVAEGARASFDIVWWVRAQSASTLIEDLAALAGRLGLPALEDPVASAAAVVRALAGEQRPWLVVFDNAPNQRAVERWLPRRGIGAVLVTSRSPTFSLADEVTAVDVWSDDVAEKFLRSRVGATNAAAGSEDLSAVIERLGGLPLALEQAAAWVTETPARTFARFVALYDDASVEPFPDGTRPSGYDHTASTTWRVSLASAGSQTSLAPKMLALLAFLAPDDLPCQWVRDLAHHPLIDGAEASAIDQALDALYAASLATITIGDTIRVHRVVQAITRRAHRDDPSALTLAITCLRQHVPGAPQDHSTWPSMAILAPHAAALRYHTSSTPHEAVNDLWWILSALATYQRESGNIPDAIASATAAAELAAARLGFDHPNTLTSHNTLAAAYLAAGDLRRAIPLYETTLADRERVLGRDHRDTLGSRNNLAAAYRSAGDVRRAIPLHEANLADCARVLGPDHPDTLTSRNNLAGAYEVSGDLRRAIPLHEATLADRERVLGPDHRDTLGSRNNLAYAYEVSGDVGRAIPLFETTLADYERVLGPDHPETLTSRNNLAAAYRSAGDLRRAIPLYETTLADRERVLGPDHPDTLSSRNNLAYAYRSAGDLRRAIPLYETTLADCARVLGPDHPDTLMSRDNLAAAYGASGDVGRAIPLHEATLADYERVLGPDHPDTLGSRNNLAYAYELAGDLRRAIPLYETTLADRERVLGPDHPHTLISRNNLARARRL
jgi:tetratricopeptide (TPR) repeat protein